MNTPREADCDKLLIVEGYSDLLFCAEFLEHLGRLDQVFIKVFGGKAEILKRKTLETELSPKVLGGKSAIGILVDGDADPTKTAARLEELFSTIAGQTVSEGVWSRGIPRLGFFVAPAPGNSGELETLVWDVWSANPANADAKDSVVEHLERMAAAGWPPRSPDKARIGAFLAAAHDEDPRLGPGARENLFDFDDPGFDRLRRFLLEFTEDR